MTENILHDGKNRITAGQYGVISMTMYYGVMTASKALGMDSSNSLYYVMFGIACIMLLFKYCVTQYTVRQIALDVLLGCIGIVCFVISHDMTLLLLAMTVAGLKDCDFRELACTAFYVRLAITSFMVVASFLGIFDQGETAQTTTSFQDITVYNFGYSTANNAYINIFVLMALFLYIRYDRINWKYFIGTSVIAMLMYTFTNSRTGTLLFFAVWFFIFCEKFLLARKGRYVFFWLMAASTLICAVFSYAATSMFNPDGGYWSEYINRIFSGRLNITHKYHEALSVSLIPRTSAVMDAHRGFGFIDNSYMSVYFHDGLIVALIVLVLICISNYSLFKKHCYKELVFIASFSVYAMMEEFPLNPVVNPFIMLTAVVIYKASFSIERPGNGTEKTKVPQTKVPQTKVPQTVLIIHNEYRIAGGEDTVAANEEKLLAEHGHRVIVYKRSNKELDNYTGIKKLLLPFTSVFSLRSYREVKKLIEDNYVDVVHVHNTLTLVSPSVYYAAFRCNVPVVQTMHNFRLLCPGGSFFMEDEGNGHICEQCVSKGLSCAVRNSCYRHSKAQTIVSAAVLKIHRMLGTYKKINFICLTEFNRYKLLMLNNGRKKIINPARVYVKPNFTYDLAETMGKLSDTHGSISGRYYVYVGRLEKLKGTELLVDAFAKLPDRKLVIMGNGPLEEILKKRIADNGYKNIVMAGRVTGEDYVKFLGGAQAVISSSQCYETFGMSIAESYSLSVPAIAGDIGNIGDIVKEGVTGIHFQYDSPDALIGAVKRFETMNRDGLAANARRYYEDNLTPQSNYGRLKEIYDDICAGYGAEKRQ
ncbi:glycosyltransferase [[Bacteroides] pectinophilus]|uniref:Glycosyl transferase family 1 domain-containing protein n=1 Tax=[Bacteroides] pectinophilus ATCC 43243 TaxID=483218 RepID=B7AUF6_9FIRM|nr:glycosyltransferase, group 1 family protein [[Bacteroides] pectinophilus ATCC 43243]UWN95800.1 glycosyltransferase [[Bacteroides] pectinophilus]